MATYQEQLAEAELRNTRAAVVACAELNTLNDGLRLLERDGIIDQEARFCFIKAFVQKHPEINKAIARQSAALQPLKESE